MLHLLRRNVDCVVLLFNNEIYGLTKGQYSPTSRTGTCTKTSPAGSIDHPVNPCAFALGAGATFVARTTDADPKHMEEVFLHAAQHKGTAFVEIMQNCVIFNDGVHAHITSKDTRSEHQLILKQGEPLLFGAQDARKGIRVRDFAPEVVESAESEAVLSTIMHHDEGIKSPAYAGLLAQLSFPEFPIPLGVFRALERACYEEEADQQLQAACEARSEKSLAECYRGFGKVRTWTV